MKEGRGEMGGVGAAEAGMVGKELEKGKEGKKEEGENMREEEVEVQMYS